MKQKLFLSIFCIINLAQAVTTASKYERRKLPIDFSKHPNINLLPARGECGIQTIQDKIYGGNVTGLDEFPWTVLLKYSFDEPGIYQCAGVLISRRYVLTAAHCTAGEILIEAGELVEVRLGEYDRNSEEDCITYQYTSNSVKVCADPVQDIGVERVITHETYNPDSEDQHNDIAVVRLIENVQLNDYVKPICLPLHEERSKPNEIITVAGWGKTEHSAYSAIKLKANMPVMKPNQCKAAYALFGRNVVDSQLCLGGEYLVDSCTGDSGGPAMRPFENSTDFYLEGIVSYGPQVCGMEGFPGIYTRVTSFMKWILNRMEP